MPEIGIIAIGRNEGDRLRRCLASLVGRSWPVVYVDSASTDGSPALARSMGADVVDLDMSVPFSAARARNEGMARLLAVAPDVAYVQMVDGDCEVVPTWIDRARQELDARPESAVVCGRRRERFPDASVYNRLADLEWDTPVGEARSCGGDAMFRVAAFQQAGGYDNTVVAGEEPELCQRLREAGWKVVRIDAEMTVHDSAMLRFGQWWKRAVRSGYGAMDVATRFRRGNDGLFVKQVRSAQNWAGIPSRFIYAMAVIYALTALSLLVGTGYWMFHGQSLASACHAAWTDAFGGPARSYFYLGTFVVGAIYFAAVTAQALRLARRGRGRVSDNRTALAYGVLTMVGKWANYRGQRQYVADRKAGKLTRLIDYKAAGAPVPTPA